LVKSGLFSYFYIIQTIQHKMMKFRTFYITLYTLFFLLFFNLCLFAQFKPPRVLQHPGSVAVEKLNVLNSTYRETNLNVSPDGKYLFFMSGRGQMPWSNPLYTTYKGRPEHDGDIWYSKKEANQWQYPQCLSGIINTSNGEDEPNISPDGQTVYFQSWRDVWTTTGGPYYKSSLNGANWGYPVGLAGGITQFFNDRAASGEALATDGATISADGNIFIVAVGDYDGNMDLYISKKNGYGYWSYPLRLNVSTLGDERSPFLAADGKTLYFASDGYGGWGGLDIFKTVLNDNGTHGEIVNVGAPFNTWLDDYGLLLTASGDDAYFVREGDIYYANTKNASNELKPFSATLLVKGTITNAKTKKGTDAKIIIKHPTTGQVIAQGQSNSLTGEYVIILPNTATKFKQEVSKTGFQKFENDFTVQIKQGLNEVVSNAELKIIEQQVVVNNNPNNVKKEEAKEAGADVGKRESILKRFE
jgi:hypothetical protein